MLNVFKVNKKTTRKSSVSIAWAPLLLTLNKNLLIGKGNIPLARTHGFSKI